MVESNIMPTCTITFNSPPQAAALRSNVQMHVRLALQHCFSNIYLISVPPSGAYMVCKSLDREGLILHGCLLMSRGGGGEVVWCLGKRSFVFERFLRSWGPCHCHLGPQKCGRWPRPNVTGFHSLTKLKDDELRTGPWMLSRSFIHSKTLLHTNSEWQTLPKPLKEGSAKKVEWTTIWYISR